MANNEPASALLRNARVVLADGTIEPASLLIQAGRIVGISDHPEQVTSFTPVVDLTGLTLFPGFIDLHIHGAVGVDTMAADVDDLRRAGEFLAQNGVTA